MNSASKRSLAISQQESRELLAADLAVIEEKLRTKLASQEPRLSDIGWYLVGAGGKRIRPLVAMTMFRACGGEDPHDMTDVAVALELIHSATLLHDDIIDGGETRRGRPSAYVQFGAADTLVAGDFLFSKAFQICGRFEEMVVEWAAQACIALTEGEIMQARLRRNPAVTVDDYWEVVRRKTACLFEQGARTAAHLAGADRHTVERVARSGDSIGMAFQVVDDVLDVVGDAAETGKPVGIDLRDGNPSLPIVLALPESPELTRIWRSPSLSDDEVSAGLRAIRECGAIEKARAAAVRHAEAAAEALAILPRTPYRDFLEGLIRELRDRVS